MKKLEHDLMQLRLSIIGAVLEGTVNAIGRGYNPYRDGDGKFASGPGQAGKGKKIKPGSKKPAAKKTTTKRPSAPQATVFVSKTAKSNFAGKRAAELGFNKPLSDKRLQELVEEELSKKGDDWHKRYAADLKASRENPTTEDTHYDRDINIWSEERQKYHEAIRKDAQKQLAALPKKAKPTLSIVMGRPGSGKGSFDKASGQEWAFYDRKEAFVIDPDHIKQQLGGQANNVNAVHEESSMLSKQVTELAKNSGTDIVLDGTLGGKSKVALAQEFIAAGYDVKLYGVSSSIELSVRSAANRYANPDSEGEWTDVFGNKIQNETGRLVDPHISNSNTNNEENFDELTGLASEWHYYTRTDGEFNFVEEARYP